jgi:hypothetical protein
MGTFRAPIHTYARSSHPARAYEKLWREVMRCIKKKKGYHTKG